jgi:hypothetical protein
MEDTQLGSMWDISEGDFYDQTRQMRTAQIASYICPSQPHEQIEIPLVMTNSFGHSHSNPDEAGNVYYGSLADYMGVKSSSCSISRNQINMGSTTDIALKVDGPICPVKRGQFTATPGTGGSANFPQGVTKYKSQVNFARITDGTSKTLMFGEIPASRANGFIDTSNAEHNGFQAFNGDSAAALFLGEAFPLADFPEKDQKPPEYHRNDSGQLVSPLPVSFGSSHPGVVQFVLCDGSVQSLSRDTDTRILDRMAQRDDGEAFSLSGGSGSSSLSSCIVDRPTGPPPPF